VVDPTGAGDSFAGGMMGYLAASGSTDPLTLRRALAYGTLVASYNVEDFSLDRLKEIDRHALDHRFQQYQSMLQI
jgi:sugar/nucleoside kinase (ribokinase family)